jgi:hypothetical protein
LGLSVFGHRGPRRLLVRILHRKSFLEIHLDRDGWRQHTSRSGLEATQPAGLI